MSKRKNPAPSDDDVSSILDQLGSVAAAPEVDSSEYMSAQELSAPSAPVGTVAEVTAEEDARPLVINLPAREDPTKVLVAAGPGNNDVVQLVEPVILGRVIANTPAFDSNGEPIQPAATSSGIDMGVTATDGNVLDAIHASTPIADAGPENQPTVQQQAVLTAYGVTAWWEPEQKYWSIRQGPRLGGIPEGASLDDWKARCASISVTAAAAQEVPEGKSN